MKPDEIQVELSELEQAIIGRQRKAFEFEVPDVLGHNKKPLGKIRMRVATLAEQEKSIKEADAYAEKNVSLRDPDAFENIKIAHVLHKVCLRINSDVPAFPGPDFMIKNLGLQELAILSNNYNEMLRVVNPAKFNFDTVTLKAFAELCSKHEDTNGPNMYLQDYSRDHVAEIAIRIACLYHEMQPKE
jgi:hypothetical protein